MNFLVLEPEQLHHTCSNGSSLLETTVTDAEQVAHITNVLKLQDGDSLKVAIVGDKLGTANIASIGKQCVKLTNILCNIPPPPKLPITLVVALPRPKALRRIIMDAVTMGIKEIYLIHSYRVEKSYWQSPHLNKIDDYVKLGLAQAGDSIVPNVHLKKRFKPFVEDELPNIIKNKHALVAHPKTSNKLSALNLLPNDEKVIVIGAEGGFIDYEIDLLTKQSCEIVQIYPRILRTETAISVLVGSMLV